MDEGLTMVDSLFVIASEASALHQPTERSFDDPAFGKNGKAGLIMGTVDDFQTDSSTATQQPKPADQATGITAIGPDDFQARAGILQETQDKTCAIAILNRGGGDDYSNRRIMSA